MNNPPAERPLYRDVEAAFDWSSALDSLGWSGQATVDLAETIVGRHVRNGKGARTAILWVGAHGTERRITFGHGTHACCALVL